ncbi:MAG: hypothetical protein JWM37_109 [Candidatus Saccharibacteria bacterium]|nr:hypothetical protein [Candidatus Saccharibacteria bacterium]
MFWTNPWYNAVVWCAFFTLIALNLYVSYTRFDLKSELRDIATTWHERRFGALALQIVVAIFMTVILLIGSSIAAVFWPIAVPVMAARAYRIYKFRHTVRA